VRTKKKTFDCVEMKRRAQQKLRAEFESRRGEFSSYSDFLAATVEESPWQREVWGKARPAQRDQPDTPQES